MKPVIPVIPIVDLKETIVAEHQDEYKNLPVVWCGEKEGQVAVSRWELSDEEIAKIIETKSIWVYLWTFGKPFNPMMITTTTPTIELQVDGVEEALKEQK